MSAPTAELLESGVCHLPGVLAPEVLSWCRDMAGDRCQSVLRHLLLRQVVAGKPAPPRCERPIPALTTHATSPPPSTRAAKHPHSDLRHHRPVSRRANHLSVSCPHGHRYAEVVEQEGRRIEVKQRTTGVLVRAVLSAEPLRNLLLAALGVQLPPPRPVPAACRRTLTQSCIGVSRPWPVVGDDAECLAAGTLVAMSSSSWSEWSELEGRGEGGGNPEASPWRAEGTHLFDVDVPLPPYALTCYVPLNDLTPENGHSCPHYSPPLPLSPPPRSIIHCLAPRGSPCRSPPLRSLPSTPSPPLLPPAPLSGPAEFARGSHVPGREYRGGERPKGGLGADGGAASAASFGMLRPLGTEGLSVGEVIDHLKQADGGAGIVEALIDAAGRGEARRPPPLAALPVAAAHQQVADDWEALVASVAQAPDWQGQPLTWSESADRVREVRPTNGLRLRQHFCLSTLPPDTASSSCRLFATFLPGATAVRVAFSRHSTAKVYAARACRRRRRRRLPFVAPLAPEPFRRGPAAAVCRGGQALVGGEARHRRGARVALRSPQRAHDGRGGRRPRPCRRHRPRRAPSQARTAR